MNFSKFIWRDQVKFFHTSFTIIYTSYYADSIVIASFRGYNGKPDHQPFVQSFHCPTGFLGINVSRPSCMSRPGVKESLPSPRVFLSLRALTCPFLVTLVDRVGRTLTGSNLWPSWCKVLWEGSQTLVTRRILPRQSPQNVRNSFLVTKYSQSSFHRRETSVRCLGWSMTKLLRNFRLRTRILYSFCRECPEIEKKDRSQFRHRKPDV